MPACQLCFVDDARDWANRSKCKSAAWAGHEIKYAYRQRKGMRPRV